MKIVLTRLHYQNPNNSNRDSIEITSARLTLFASNAADSILVIDLNVSLSDLLISVQEDFGEKT